MNFKKGNALYVIIAIVVVLLIVGGCCFALIGGKNSSKGVFRKQVNLVFDSIDKALDEAQSNYEDTKDKDVSMKSTIKPNLNLSDSIVSSQELKDLQSKINQTTIKFDSDVSVKDSFVKLSLGLLLNEKDLFNAEADVKENTAYFKLKDVIDDYVKIDLEGEELDLSEVDVDSLKTIEDINTIYDTIKPIVKKEILKGKITSSKEEIKIGDKEIKAKKNQLTVDSKLAHQIAIDCMTAIKDNKKAFNSLLNIAKSQDEEMTEEKLIKDIDDAIESIQKDMEKLDDDNNEKIDFVIYTKGMMAKPLKYEISSKNAGKLSVTINKNDDNKDVYEVVFNDGGSDSKDFKINITKLSKSEVEIDTEIDIDADYDVTLKLNGKLSKKGCDLNYTLKEDKTSVSGKLLIEVTEQNKKNSKAHVEFSIDTGKDIIGTVAFTMDSEITLLDSIDVPDFSKSITIDQIDENTYTKLETKLGEVLKEYGLDLDSILGSLFGFGYDDDYDYDYDYDDYDWDDYDYDDYDWDSYDYNF